MLFQKQGKRWNNKLVMTINQNIRYQKRKERRVPLLAKMHFLTVILTQDRLLLGIFICKKPYLKKTLPVAISHFLDECMEFTKLLPFQKYISDPKCRWTSSIGHLQLTPTSSSTKYYQHCCQYLAFIYCCNHDF